MNGVVITADDFGVAYEPPRLAPREERAEKTRLEDLCSQVLAGAPRRNGVPALVGSPSAELLRRYGRRLGGYREGASH